MTIPINGQATGPRTITTKLEAGPEAEQVSAAGQVGLIGRDSWELIADRDFEAPKVYGDAEAPTYGNVELAPPPKEMATEVRPSNEGMVKLGDIGDLLNKYTAAPIWEATITKNTFRSWGDPHEVTASGRTYDNQKVGDFIALESSEGDLLVEKRQDHVAGFNPQTTLNTTIAIRYLKDLIWFNATTDDLEINGKKVPVSPARTLTLPTGTTVTTGGGKVHVLTAKGDVIDVLDQGKYLDLEGAVSKKRTLGSVFGELGKFADDRNLDLTLRQGYVTSNVDLFLEEWRVRAGESILP